MIDYSEALTFLTPRIEFHARNWQGAIPGLQYEDLVQELRIELWKKIERIPSDMKLDFRLSRYFETAFRRRIYDLNRLRLHNGGKNGKKQYRDCADYWADVPLDEIRTAYLPFGDPADLFMTFDEPVFRDDN